MFGAEDDGTYFDVSDLTIGFYENSCIAANNPVTFDGVSGQSILTTLRSGLTETPGTHQGTSGESTLQADSASPEVTLYGVDLESGNVTHHFDVHSSN